MTKTAASFVLKLGMEYNNHIIQCTYVSDYVHGISASGGKTSNDKCVMSKPIIIGDDQIPCNGTVIIQHLETARNLLTSLKCKRKVQLDAANEQARNIETVIVEVATLCSGSNYWHQLHDYLNRAGIEVSPEFCRMKLYLDRIMDENPAEAKRN